MDIDRRIDKWPDRHILTSRSTQMDMKTNTNVWTKRWIDSEGQLDRQINVWSNEKIDRQTDGLT